MSYLNKVFPTYLTYLSNTPFEKHSQKNSILFPTKLNRNDCANEISIEDDELTMSYNVQEQHQLWYMAAAARTDYPLPVKAGVFYFEVFIINQGLDGLIGIGMGESDVSLHGQPGWSGRSYGYHGDDGLKFISDGSQGFYYGPLYSADDTIGCCVNFFNNTCFYTKNGISLGVAFDDISGELYPTFGMRNPEARIKINFGQEPFVFDIDRYAKKYLTV